MFITIGKGQKFKYYVRYTFPVLLIFFEVNEQK